MSVVNFGNPINSSSFANVQTKLSSAASQFKGHVYSAMNKTRDFVLENKKEITKACIVAGVTAAVVGSIIFFPAALSGEALTTWTWTFNEVAGEWLASEMLTTTGVTALASGIMTFVGSVVASFGAGSLYGQAN